MLIESKDILHVFDKATMFPNATYLDSECEKYVQYVHGYWPAFVIIWCTMYIGYSNSLKTYRDYDLTTQRRKQLLNINGVELHLSGAKAHSSLGIGGHFTVT